jgi:hypothetical protein
MPAAQPLMFVPRHNAEGSRSAAAVMRRSLHGRASTTIRQTSIVECREQLKLIRLALVMIDEELRLIRRDQLPDLLH